MPYDPTGRIALLFVAVLVVGFVYGARGEIGALELNSAAFRHGETIPMVHTCDGDDVSPPFAWSGVPDGTRSIAFVCTDPDAPRGTWIHWVLFNLPGDLDSLSAAIDARTLPGEGKNGRNSWGRTGYGGPCPPRGPAHRYFFTVYALDSALDLDEGATLERLTRAMKGHTLAQGTLMARYARK